MESKVANTLLEEKQTIVIGEVSHKMAPPSIATLVLASKYIKQLPAKALSTDNLISEMMQNADKLIPLGSALSVMILGAKTYASKETLSFKHLYKKRKTKGELLANKINTADIKHVLGSFFRILEVMNLNDFFQLTTFLIELNITKRTKKVVD
jgi:hypothetical protein